jgi:2-amino-4-hydroxy-6-hydroxymethyldihydropteridine diphosphokinase
MDAWVGLGANLGDAAGAVEAALHDLAGLPGTRMLARSRLWSSAPVDADGPDYVNAVARLDTDLAPTALLAALQAIERRHGRRRPHAGAPRTLDLDLLLYGLDVVAAPDLQVPHPRLHERAFVLRPMADIDADVPIPGHGTVRQCLRSVAHQRCDPLPPAEAA